MEEQIPFHYKNGHNNRSEVIMEWKDVLNMDDFLDRVSNNLETLTYFYSFINTMKGKVSCVLCYYPFQI